MKSSVVRTGVLVLTVVLVGAACGKSTPQASGSPPAPSGSASATGSGGGQITIGSDTANDHGSKVVSGASSVDVEMDDFYFGPTVLTGTPGQTITIKLDNHGSALHNFSTTAKDFTDVQPGQSGSVTVTFPQSGFLEFFCKYHRSSGMVGELTTS